MTKRYDDGTLAVDDLSLEVADGELMILVGPSGCGKSTALRMVAGLEDITDGELRVDGVVVNERPPKDRDVAMVFQNYALYPHMSVARNMGFALKIAGVDKAEIERRVRDAADILELTEFLDRRPAKLSGGQRQRVAMGRAIVRQPKAFLMDEPLSNLDAKMRVQMRADIAKLQRDLKVTTVYVTHDQVEAMTMGDRVAVLNRGVLMQVDSPQNLYDYPANLFVAAFIGSPQMNLLRGRLEVGDAGGSIMLGGHRITIPATVFASRRALAEYAGKEVAVGIRPEDVSDVPPAGTDGTNVVTGEVAVREGLGNEVVVHMHCDAPTVNVVVEKEDDQLIDSSVFIGRLGPRPAVRVGEPATLYVDTERLHFFDLETSNAIT